MSDAFWIALPGTIAAFATLIAVLKGAREHKGHEEVSKSIEKKVDTLIRNGH